MKLKLIETDNNILIHTGPLIDKYWGVQNKSENNGYGFGENHHGIILMKLEDIMSKEIEYTPKKSKQTPKKELNKHIKEPKQKTKKEPKQEKTIIYSLFTLPSLERFKGIE